MNALSSVVSQPAPHDPSVDRLVGQVILAIILLAFLVGLATLWKTLRSHTRRVTAMKNCDQWLHEAVVLRDTLKRTLAGLQLPALWQERMQVLEERLTGLVLENFHKAKEWRMHRDDWHVLALKCKMLLNDWKAFGRDMLRASEAA